jgi:hypothetical protein
VNWFGGLVELPQKKPQGWSVARLFCHERAFRRCAEDGAAAGSGSTDWDSAHDDHGNPDPREPARILTREEVLEELLMLESV